MDYHNYVLDSCSINKNEQTVSVVSHCNIIFSEFYAHIRVESVVVMVSGI